MNPQIKQFAPLLFPSFFVAQRDFVSEWVAVGAAMSEDARQKSLRAHILKEVLERWLSFFLFFFFLLPF